MLDRTEQPRELPFVAKTGEGAKRDFWCPRRAGSWSEDNAIGRTYASELMEKMRESEAPMLLGNVVQAMIAKGTYGGVETGFFSAISTELL